MDLESVLRNRVKPELNFLFTESPAIRNGGMDYGWFCREHAFLSYFVCRLLGFEAAICCGDVTLSDQHGDRVLSTIEDDYDHSWLAVGGVRPVDLSIDFSRFPQPLPSLGLVYGTGKEGGYWVTCDDESDVPTDLYHLQYTTAERLKFADADLLDDPFMFLHKPPDGGLPRVFGADIYAKITWHLYRVAIAEIGPYRDYVADQPTAFKRIGKKNPDVTTRIISALTAEEHP